MNCDRIASVYRWLEYLRFGRALEHCRNYHLDSIGTRQRALLLGDGDGRFLENCLRANSAVMVDSVDISEKMQCLARGRAALAPDGLRRVRFIQSDARWFQPIEAYDLIATHFFLDCLTENEIEALAARIQRPPVANTRWIVSEFRIPADGLASRFGSALIQLMYACFRVATGLRVRELPNYRGVLKRHGFQLIEDHQSLGGLLTSEVWDRDRTG